jgi:hypothetical protein
MATEIVKFKITGTRPLLMHNGQLANPTCDAARDLKRVSTRKKKTDDDLEEVKRLEWFGGLYLTDDKKPCLTEDMVLGAVVEGARKRKLGKSAQAGVLCTDARFPLEYKGPKDVTKLYEDPSFCEYRTVRVNSGRVMRARPKFNQWAVTVELTVDTESMTVDDVQESLEVAGRMIGMGDFRPRYGRFEVARVK